MWFQNSLFLSGSLSMPVLFPSLSTVPIQTNQTPTPQWQQQRLSWSQGSGQKRWQIYTTLQHTHKHTHTQQHRLTAASPGTLSVDQQIETEIEREKVHSFKSEASDDLPPSPLQSSLPAPLGLSGRDAPHLKIISTKHPNAQHFCRQCHSRKQVTFTFPNSNIYIYFRQRTSLMTLFHLKGILRT